MTLVIPRLIHIQSGKLQQMDFQMKMVSIWLLLKVWIDLSDILKSATMTRNINHLLVGIIIMTQFVHTRRKTSNIG